MVIAFAGGLLYSTGWNAPLLNTYIARGLLSFFVGCALAKFSFIVKEMPKKQKAIYGYGAFIIILAIHILSRLYGYEKVIGNIGMYVPLMFVPLLIISIVCIDWLNKILSLKFLTHLGEISMSLYMIHHPLMNFVQFINFKFELNIDFSNEIVWLIYMIFTLGLADINHRIFKKLKNRTH